MFSLLAFMPFDCFKKKHIGCNFSSMCLRALIRVRVIVNVRTDEPIQDKVVL